mmetsp:Transcript_23477/g.61732  ORF Transcript_23477/g.61732 Transcript_23477/m.61732 type:complete len:88 (-) Transcript_23477:999-1262(-)
MAKLSSDTRREEAVFGPDRGSDHSECPAGRVQNSSANARQYNRLAFRIFSYLESNSQEIPNVPQHLNGRGAELRQADPCGSSLFAEG